MNAAKMDQFRNQLLELSRRLRGDIQSLDEQARVPVGGDSAGDLSSFPIHPGDVGSVMYLQELNATLLENQQSIQDEVLEALRRIDEGTYGTCERCGEKILEERLELLPYTRYCARCATEIQTDRSD
jgi:RNA polymerase-binding transcription factor DksA